MLILTILMTTTLCCFMNHPLTLGFILLLQTIMIALLTGLLSLNFWSSYIIFLIMIGGLLILFIYMTSVASNEKFKFSTKLFLLMTFFMLNTTVIFFFLDKFLMSQKLNMIETFPMYENIKPQFFLNKFINFPHNLIYLMMVIYLLITLIAIVKITSKTKGTLRKNF
uniref:NADH-ubiquinone oxidoreductase chain 6 n=1 Tax=Cryptocephalus quadripunctatus TaxID=1425558 RepID=A0A3G1GQV6_9CUCU|nr:NADH dehydrogenase subunit 6 [Cryptocephalus quadripunctatus]